MTFEATLSPYLRARRADGLASSSAAAYATDLNQAFTYFHAQGVHTLDALTPKVVRHWLVTLADSNYQSASRARKLHALAAWGQWLVDEDLIATNPTRGVRAPKVTQTIPLAPSPEVLIQLLDLSYPIPRDHAALALLATTGLRRSEVLALNWSDCDLANRILHVRHGKGGKDRLVPLTHVVVRALNRYHSYRRDNQQAVLLGRTGNRLNRDGLTRIVRKYGARLGIVLTPHVFRHGTATHLLRSGADIITVKDLLGHADIQTTARYAHTALPRMRAAVDHWVNGTYGTCPRISIPGQEKENTWNAPPSESLLTGGWSDGLDDDDRPTSRGDRNA